MRETTKHSLGIRDFHNLDCSNALRVEDHKMTHFALKRIMSGYQVHN